MLYSSSRRHAAGVILVVDCRGGGARGIAEVERAEIRRLELHRYAAALLLVVGQRAADEIFVAREIGGEPLDALELFVAREHFFLKRDVDAHVGRAAGSLGVIERVEKRIYEKNPVESLGIEIRRHHCAIRKHGFSVQLVDNRVEIFCVAGGFGSLGFVGEPFHVFGGKIRVGITDHLLRRDDELGIVGARAHEIGFARNGGHRIDVAVVAKAGMRVIVVHGDFFDLREQAIVDFLDIGTGEWLGLGAGGDGEPGCGNQCDGNLNQPFHSGGLRLGWRSRAGCSWSNSG